MGKGTTAGLICRRIAQRAPAAALLATAALDPAADKPIDQKQPSLLAAGALLGAEVVADATAGYWAYCTQWGKDHPMIVYGITKLAPVAVGVTLCFTQELEVSLTIATIGSNVVCDGLGSLWQYCCRTKEVEEQSDEGHHDAALTGGDAGDEEAGLGVAVADEPNTIAHLLAVLSLSDSTLITNNITRQMLFKQQAHRLSPAATVFTALTLYFAKDEELTYINTAQFIKELKELGLNKLTEHEQFITLHPSAFNHGSLCLPLVERVSPAKLNITRARLVGENLDSIIEKDDSLEINIKDLVTAVEARFTVTQHAAAAAR